MRSDDLSDMARGFHACLGLLQPREVEHLVDPRLDAAGSDERHHVRDKARHGGRSLLLAAQLVGDAEQREPSGVQRFEVDVGVQHAVDVPHGGETAFEGQRANVLGEHRAADGVDDEVGAMPFGGLHHRGRKVGGTRAQRDVQAERRQQRQLVRRSRGADDLRPQHFAQLQRGHAHTRRHAVDQQPLAGLEAALQHQHVVGHQEGQRDAGGRFPRQARRHRDGLGPFHQRVLGKRAGATAHHTVARLEASDAVADRDDLAGTFAADGFPRAGLAMQAVAEHELTAIQRGSVHTHQQLARCRLRQRRVAQFERGGRVGHLHPPGLHRRVPSGRRRPARVQAWRDLIPRVGCCAPWPEQSNG